MRRLLIAALLAVTCALGARDAPAQASATLHYTFDYETKKGDYARAFLSFRTGDVSLLEDLGSVNAPIVTDNVRLAPHQPRALESGDRLRLGETTLHFLIG